MSRNKHIILCTSKNREDAVKVNTLLEENGIASILRSVTLDSFLVSKKPVPVMVEIDEKDYNDAKIILKQ